MAQLCKYINLTLLRQITENHIKKDIHQYFKKKNKRFDIFASEKLRTPIKIFSHSFTGYVRIILLTFQKNRETFSFKLLKVSLFFNLSIKNSYLTKIKHAFVV